jgi:hypothetical protein
VFIAATIIIFLLPFIDYTLGQKIFSYGGYYLILSISIFWIITITQTISYHRLSFKDFIKKYGKGTLLSLIITVIIFTSVKCYFRVLSDETNLACVSKSMTYERRTDNITMGKWYYDNFYPIKRLTPTRPLFFPFLTNIVSVVSGYRPENAFAVNFIALFSLLFLLYILVKKRLGDIWAISTVLLVASQPVVSQAATSGGYDLLAVLFVVIYLASLERFLKKPSPFSFQFLWVNLLILSNIRYEGILYFIICMGALLLLRYINLDSLKIRINPLYFSTPLILLFLSWPRALMNGLDSGVPFALLYIVKNIKAFFKIFFDFRFFLPYATIVNTIGLASLLWLGSLFLASRIFKEKHKRHFVLVSTSCLLANLLLFMTFHNARADHPTVSRLYLLFCVLLSVIAIVGLSMGSLTRRKPVYILAFSIIMFMLYHPVSIKDRFSKTLLLPREYRFVTSFLKKEATKGRNFLIVAARPGQYTAYDWGAVDFDYIGKNKDIIIEYQNRLYRDIFVIQEIDYRTLEPTPETALTANFTLETLTEVQKGAKSFVRISRIVSEASPD